MAVWTKIMVASACALALPAGAATLEEVTAKIGAAWEQEDLFEASMVVDAILPTGSDRVYLQGSGKVSSLRESGVERYRSELRVVFEEPMRTGIDVETLFDGETLYSFNEALGSEYGRRIDEKMAYGAVPPGGALLMEALAQHHTLTLLPDGEFDERTTYRIEGRASRDGETAMFERLVAEIDQETGTLLRLELFERPHVKTAKITLNDLDFDPALDPASFEVEQGQVP